MNYKKIYDQFIADRLNKQPKEYIGKDYHARLRGKKPKNGIYEHHHIIPREFGGLNNSENIVSLTIEDHLHAHILLASFMGGRQWVAVNMMLNCSKKNGRTMPGKLMRKAYALSKKHTSGENNPDRDKTIYKFKHIDGDEFLGTRHDLSVKMEIPLSSVVSILNGQGRSAYGWYLPNLFDVKDIGLPKRERNNKFNATIYRWKNVDTGDFESKTLYDMHIKYGGSRASWTSVISNDKPTIFGWCLADKEIIVRSSKGKIFNFVNRDGRKFTGTQVDFVNYAKTTSTTATRVVKYKSVTRCGWRLDGVDDRSHNSPKNGSKPGKKGNVYTLINGDKKISGDRSYLADKLNTNVGCISASIYAMKKQVVSNYKGWKLAA